MKWELRVKVKILHVCVLEQKFNRNALLTRHSSIWSKPTQVDVSRASLTGLVFRNAVPDFYGGHSGVSVRRVHVDAGPASFPSGRAGFLPQSKDRQTRFGSLVEYKNRPEGVCACSVARDSSMVHSVLHAMTAWKTSTASLCARYVVTDRRAAEMSKFIY